MFAKLSVVILALTMAAGPVLACNPMGWTRVGEKFISASEKLCIYEKNGTQVQIIVTGYCPTHPC